MFDSLSAGVGGFTDWLKNAATGRLDDNQIRELQQQETQDLVHAGMDPATAVQISMSDQAAITTLNGGSADTTLAVGEVVVFVVIALAVFFFFKSGAYKAVLA